MGPIILFTDFGVDGPYVGQLHGRLAALAPSTRVIDLLHTVAPLGPRPASYLLASLVPEFPEDAIFVCVVDPGVGTERRPLLVRAAGRWLVGPDNGLLEVVARQAGVFDCWEIQWRPACLAPTFHGRDLFAPVAAALAAGEWRDRVSRCDWTPRAAPDLAEIIFIDGFGNAATGLRGAGLSGIECLRCRGQTFRRAATFADADSGQPLWYVNSNGLAELAANQQSAALTYGLSVGDEIFVG